MKQNRTGLWTAVAGAALLVWASLEARAEEPARTLTGAKVVISGTGQRAEGMLVPVMPDETAFEGYDVVLEDELGDGMPLEVVKPLPMAKGKEFLYKGKKLKAVWGVNSKGSIEKAKILAAEKLNRFDAKDKLPLLCKVPEKGAMRSSGGTVLIIEIIEPGSMGVAHTRIIIRGGEAQVITGGAALPGK